MPYAIGGCRELTADGHIIGAFTDQVPNDTVNPAIRSKAYFFHIKGQRFGNHIAAFDQAGNASLQAPVKPSPLDQGV